MKRYVTDANNTLSQDELGFTRNPDAELHLITCRPDVAYQRISGFGGAFTEAAANVFALMPRSCRTAFCCCASGERRMAILPPAEMRIAYAARISRAATSR